MTKEFLFVALLLLVSVAAQKESYVYDSSYDVFVCKEGDTQCVGSVFRICKGNSWIEEKCSDICTPSGCSFAQEETRPPLTSPIVEYLPRGGAGRAVCPVGERRCSGQNFQICDLGGWRTVQTCGRDNVCTRTGCSAIEVVGGLTPPVSRARLDCPVFVPSVPVLPSLPFDPLVGDCSLVGRRAEIDTFLAELRRIADGCRIRISSAYASTGGLVSGLRAQVGELRPSTSSGGMPCPPVMVNVREYSLLTDDYLGRAGWSNSTTLAGLRWTVGAYCNMADELIERIVAKCGGLNTQIGCFVGQRGGVSESERGSLSGQLDGLVLDLSGLRDRSDQFYNFSLGVFGLDQFRRIYDEDELRRICMSYKAASPPLRPPAEPPGFMARFWAYVAGLFGK
jgi:hypothetical protein